MFIKEFLQMFRDPRMRVLIFGAPVLQMLVFGIAVTTDVTDIRTAVLDSDRSVASRELIDKFTSSGYFKVVEYIDSDGEIENTLVRGHARVVLHVPHGFERKILAGETAQLQVIADGTDSNTTAIVMGYAGRIVGDYSREKLLDKISRLSVGFTPSTVDIETRAWFNPNMESRFFYIPGLIALILVLFTMVLTSIAIVREKEIGTIEQIMVTPISRTEFILGKTVPFAIVGYFTMTLMLVVGMLVFGIRVQGSWLLLYGLTGIYLISNLGLGLTISASASTQQQALLTAFFFLVPAILLSGFLIPVHNMPEIIQYATYINPMRWYMDILRSVVIKGVGASDIRQAIIGLSILAIGFTILASVRFRKTMS